MYETEYDLCVVGCGASGMSCAITAARRGLRVIVIEKNKKPGRKLYATGNGRCNLSNRDVDLLRDYRSSDGAYGEFAKQALGDRPDKKIEEFLKSMGILTYEQNQLLYPSSLQASAVVWAMADELKRLKVKLKLKSKVTSILREASSFQITCDTGTFSSRRVVLACGSPAYPSLGGCKDGIVLAESMGHVTEKTRPALCGLVTKEDLSSLSGVRAKATAVLRDPHGNEVAREKGELQITDYGISGILIFNLSSPAGAMLLRGDAPAVSFDFLGEKEKELSEALEHFSCRTVIGILNGFLHDRIAFYVANLCGIARETLAEELDQEQKIRLISAIRNFTVTIEDTCGFDSAQVCAGGVSLREVSPKTMESKLVPGIFLTGELLDIDGRCGGYNLTFAIISGINAGNGAYDKNQSD